MRAGWRRSRGDVTRSQKGTRLVFPALVSTTKPPTSRCFADRAAGAVSGRGPGRVSPIGLETVIPGVDSCGLTVTLQSPAPPPASVTATVRRTDLPGRRSPIETVAGAEKI